MTSSDAAVGAAASGETGRTRLALELAPPGDLRARADLRRLVERQARRDTLALVAALFDEDEVVRARGALALGSFSAASAAPALVALLADEHADVRAFSAFALGQIGASDIAPPLIDALRLERDPAARKQIMDALGKSADRSALAALAGMRLPLAEEPSRAIAMARFGIRGVFDPQATALLARQLDSDDHNLSRSAAYFFGRITEVSSWRDHADAVRSASDGLAPENPAQAHLALALGRLNDPTDQPRLERLLGESSDWRVRTNAARALSGRRDASGALLAALDDSVHHVGVAAALSLASGDAAADVVPLLVAWAEENPDQWVVWTAFLPALARSADTEDLLRTVDLVPTDGAARPFARAVTVRALAEADDPAILSRLIDAGADDDVRVASAAIEALRHRWDRERSDARADALYPVFAEAIRRADVATVYAAAPALADSMFFARGAGEVMRETYFAMEVPRDIEPMTAIVRAHGAARDTSALNFLVDVALNGGHPVIRHAAADALDRRFGEGIDFEATGLRAPAFPVLDERRLARLGARPRLVLETERGVIDLELEPDWAPMTVLSITRLARAGTYDGVPFHRIVPNFVIQGGDFARADGFGGPDYFLPSEFTPIPYETGTLGMASSGPDTEGSQFFVTHSMQPHLDGRYTVFGRVIAGQDVVDAIRPGDRIIRARVIDS